MQFLLDENKEQYEIGSADAALCVLHFLEQHHFQASREAFATEAQSLLSTLSPASMQQKLKSLETILREYVEYSVLKLEQKRRQRLFGTHITRLFSSLTELISDYKSLGEASALPSASASSGEGSEVPITPSPRPCKRARSTVGTDPSFPLPSMNKLIDQLATTDLPMRLAEVCTLLLLAY